MKSVLAVLLLGALFATLAGPADAGEPTPAAKAPRFPPFTMEQLNVYQKPLGEQIMKVSSVGRT